MKLLRLFAALVIALCSFSAKADQFNFSYTFGSGDIVTGSLFGTQNSLYVENISNVSVSLNGTLFSGSPNLNQYGWVPDCCLATSIPPLVSFNGNLNNFGFFTGSPYVDGGAPSWFAMLAVNGPYQSVAVYLDGHYSSDVSLNGFQVISPEIQGAFDASHWVLTPVPEPETYALMLAGLGVLGFAARRRKQQSLQA